MISFSQLMTGTLNASPKTKVFMPSCSYRLWRSFLFSPRFQPKSFMLQGCISVILASYFEGKLNTEVLLMFSFQSEDYAVIQFSYTTHEILKLLYTDSVSCFLFSLCKNSTLASLLLYRRWKKYNRCNQQSLCTSTKNRNGFQITM